jgi:hypothetical protein
MYRLFLSSLVAGFAVLAAISAFDAGRTFHRFVRLSHAGIAVDATVLRKDLVREMPSFRQWGPGMSRTPYVFYRFRTGDGAVRPGEGQVALTRFEQIQRGSSIKVVVDPTDPGTNAPDLYEVLARALRSLFWVLAGAVLAIVFAREWRRQPRRAG